MRLTSASQPPKPRRGTQSWHCFSWSQGSLPIRTQYRKPNSPGNSHTPVLSRRNRLGRGSVVDLVEILVFARGDTWRVEGVGNVMFRTVILDNRNLTSLSSFGKLTWDILGFRYEMLDSWICLMTLFFGEGPIWWFLSYLFVEWVRTWEFGAEEAITLSWKFCINCPLHVWIRKFLGGAYESAGEH